MNRDEIKDIVLKYVIEEYQEDETDEISYDTPLISGGIVDSFSMVSLINLTPSSLHKMGWE